MRIIKLKWYILSFWLISCCYISKSLSAQDSTTLQASAVYQHPAEDFSYAYGFSFARDLNEKAPFSKEELNLKNLLKGLKDGLQADSTQLAAVNAFLDDLLVADSSSNERPKATLIAYNLGYSAIANVIFNFDIDPVDFSYNALKKGMTDYYKTKQSILRDGQMDSLLSAYFNHKQMQVQQVLARDKAALAQQNLEEAEAFLADNANKKGIQTTASGLQYQVIKSGTGPKAQLTNIVETHYHGTFIDGSVFDSSIDRGEATEFQLNTVIPGWQEGLQLMNAGSRFRFFIPPHLAYGEQPPALIPPNVLLIFDVELLQIKEAPAVDSASVNMSYSYGFMIGKTADKLKLSAAERDPNYFVQGFASGFKASSSDLQQVEALLKARLDAEKVSETEQAAQQIAFAVGYTSSAGLFLQFAIEPSDFILEALGMGFNDAVANRESKLTDAQMNTVLREYFEPRAAAKQQADAADNAQIIAKNKKEGAAFLAENAQKEGVVVLDNGMQYQIIKASTGPKPTVDDKVTTHYTGTLIDGTVFDASVGRGEPATFPLNAVIEGWQIGIPLMSEGATYRFFIPAELAYGDKGAGQVIQPGATLIFEVQLLKIN